jgi:predicted ATPase/DNA-binding CsgD family transcriptional regulator
MLADIGGSPPAGESDRELISQGAARYFELIDHAVEQAGGSLEHGERHSVVAGFSRAPDAVRAAIEIQRAAAHEGPPGSELGVRIALHTGDLQSDPDDHRVRSAIERCARLRSIGHGGQTLLSQSTRDLVTDKLPADAFLEDLGVHRLRDLSRAEHVYQLRLSGGQATFPPLASLDAVPNNLPVQLTSFVGREAEMGQLRALLVECRLVTVTGSGGCGKTRLALQVAADLVETYPEGVWLVDLAPVVDPDLVAASVAAAMQIREVPMQDFTETLKRQLRDQRLLLVLDNCEHLVSSCAAVAEALLTSCPGVTILATSREPLAVRGETTWRVPSLSVPAERARPPIEDVTQYEAVRLFVDRALKANPGFAVTPGNAAAVAEICRRIDGIPLAIELAAARASAFTVEQIAGALEDRFVLLTRGSRTALPRQRTLESSVDWSYALLEEDERTLLRRLSVFAGGFDLDATEDVCSGDGLDRDRVVPLLGQLVDRSLVQVDGGGSRGRYRLLETIRLYARRKAVDSGELTSVRTRHLDHYLALAEEAEPEIEGPGLRTWAARLEADYDNLRAAMEWSLESRQVEKALRLPGAQLLFWLVRSHMKEGEGRVAAALALVGGDPRSRAAAVVTAAGAAAWLLEAEGSHRFGEEALALGRSLGDSRVIGRALTYLGWAAIVADPTGAEPVLLEAIAASDDAGDAWYSSQSRVSLGFNQMQLGLFQQARDLLEQGIAIARRNGDALNVREGLTYLGFTSLFQGRVAEAQTFGDEALVVVRELQDEYWRAIVLQVLAFVAVHRGDYERARAMFREGVELARDQGNIPGIACGTALHGYLESMTGDLDSAESLVDEALLFSRAMEFKILIAAALVARGCVEAGRGNNDKAFATLGEAADVSRKAGLVWTLGRALVARARLDREIGAVDTAEDAVHEALTAFVSSGDEAGVIDALEALAGIAVTVESCQEAVRLMGAASAHRERLGYARFPIAAQRYDRDLAAARTALGAESFERERAHGAQLSAAEAVAYARRGRGERKRPSSGWTSLTPAEIQVVRLAARGMTNPQIAQRLFISPGTAKNHLSHVFAKLGIATRSELAAEAARRGL